MLSQESERRQLEIEPFEGPLTDLVLLPLRADYRILEIANGLQRNKHSRQIGFLTLINHHSAAPQQIKEQNQEVYQLLQAIQRGDIGIISQYPENIAAQALTLIDGPQFRSIYTPDLPNIHFGKLRKKLIELARASVPDSEDIICHLWDADTQFSTAHMNRLRKAFNSGIAANIASHDLLPAVLSNNYPEYDVQEIREFNEVMLENYDCHRYIDFANNLHSMLLATDSFPTNTPAISARLSVLACDDIYALLDQYDVAEDYALAGTLRQDYAGNLGLVSQILYGQSMRIKSPYSTHWGDAEERADLNSYLNGGEIYFEINPLKTTLLELCARKKCLFELKGMNFIRNKILQGDYNITQDLINALCQTIPHLEASIIPELEGEMLTLQRIIIEATLAYDQGYSRDKMFRFMSPYSRNPVGISIKDKGTDKEEAIYSQYITLALYDSEYTTSQKLPEHPSYNVKTQYQQITDLLFKLTQRLYELKQQDNMPFPNLIAEKRKKFLKYEHSLLVKRGELLQNIILGQEIDLESGIPYEEYYGQEIRRKYYEFLKRNPQSALRETIAFIVTNHPDLLTFSPIHDCIVTIRALQEISIENQLAFLDSDELLESIPPAQNSFE